MYPQWSPMQSNEKPRYEISQQPINQGFFQFQQSFPCMWQQQSQQQGQFMSQTFSSFPPFPNNVNGDVRYINNPSPPSYTDHMYTRNNNHSSQQYPSQSFHFERKEGDNKMSYERNPGQEQYASYPQDAMYRHASGPGWQQQEVVYPARLFK